MPPTTKRGNGPVTIQLASRVASSITVDNFIQRIERLKELSEDEYQRTTDTTVFQSNVVPISHSEAHNDIINLYNVVVEIELMRRRQVSSDFIKSVQL